jgi:hypothetical protein
LPEPAVPVIKIVSKYISNIEVIILILLIII